jgi:deoxycytidylate deaminase
MPFVQRATLRIGQRVVGLGQIDRVPMRTVPMGAIHRELVGLSDALRRGVARDAEQLVEVLPCHERTLTHALGWRG